MLQHALIQALNIPTGSSPADVALQLDHMQDAQHT